MSRYPGAGSGNSLFSFLVCEPRRITGVYTQKESTKHPPKWIFCRLFVWQLSTAQPVLQSYVFGVSSVQFAWVASSFAVLQLVSAFDRPGLHISSPSTFYPLGSAFNSHFAKVRRIIDMTKGIAMKL